MNKSFTIDLKLIFLHELKFFQCQCLNGFYFEKKASSKLKSEI